MYFYMYTYKRNRTLKIQQHIRTEARIQNKIKQNQTQDAFLNKNSTQSVFDKAKFFYGGSPTCLRYAIFG